MANTLIKLRRGPQNWWNVTNTPSGATGYPNGIVDYGANSSYNYDTTGGNNIFHQLSITNGEPWVNTYTKQLWIDNVVINPAIKLTLNGSAVNSSMTFDTTSYEVQQVFNIQTTDQYLEKVASMEIPTTSAGASDIQAFMVNVIGGQASDYTATLNNDEWTVTWGTSNSQTFNAGGDYIGFGWALSTGVTTPTFLEIPETDTKSKNVIASSASGTADSSADLANGNVFLNNVETVGGVASVSSSVKVEGTADIGVTYDQTNNKIQIGHTTSITAGTTTFSLSGNQLTSSKITYDAYGHITGIASKTVNLPTGGSGSANTFNVDAEITDSVSPTQGKAQAVIIERHDVSENVITISGTAGQTTVTNTGSQAIADGHTLTYNNRNYTVQTVSGQTITISPALEDSITSGEIVVWTHPTQSSMFKLQQSGLTSSTLSTYDGTKVTFAKATQNSDTASNSDFASTILMNVDVIDGGTFN